MLGDGNVRYLIKFSYDGTNYNGYQRQKGLNTVQECLEDALTSINNKKKVIVHATGRTDKLVHALAQYAHFDLDVKITENKLKRAMNSNLPLDIHVIEAREVPDNFHARYNVKSKEYKYLLNMGEYDPINRNYIYQYNHILNIDKMKEAINYFKGTHDFRSFVTENKVKENCVRTITKATIKEKNNIVTFTFKGNGFLRYQVRNMVGILIKVGEEKIKPSDVLRILNKKNRDKEGVTAKAEGLYLVDVKFKKS